MKFHTSALQLTFDFIRLGYTKGLRGVLISVLFLLGIIYLVLPGPQTIDDFPALPDSVKSELPGDTYQNSNIAAYFSDFRREYIMDYYWNYFKDWSYFGLKLPVFKINHPPERAYTFIRDQQESTALEEYYVPFRGSIFVNVHDPIIYNQIRRRQLDFATSHVDYNYVYYNTKTTIRYFPTPVVARIGVYVLTLFSIYMMLRLIQYYRKQQV